MGSLPKEVFESAAIDGANPAVAFFRLADPDERAGARRPGDLPVPVRLERPPRRADLPRRVEPENLPLTVVIANLVNSLGSGWHLLGAAAFISMALPLLVFFALQRYFVRGITGGAVKG
jgi:alpha-glucoside transport system permease protein